MTEELLFLPLGGAGEIGMNLNLYGYGDPKDPTWLMIDLGVTFGDGSPPGVDLITPDPSFIEARKDRLAGLVLTHAHEDHYGGLAQLCATRPLSPLRSWLPVRIGPPVKWGFLARSFGR